MNPFSWLDNKFIAFEGIEGVGKTTAIEYLAKNLAQSGVKFVNTREPGGTKIGEKIRNILLDPTNDNLVADAELLLLFAARTQHIFEVIQPNLQQGNCVLCDRFTAASYAYQGGGRKIPKHKIAMLEQEFQHGLAPDLTFIFDAPVDVALQRIAMRNDKFDRIEQEKIEFFTRVRDSYLELAVHNQDKFIIVDATQSISQVQQFIIQYLSEKEPC